MLQSLYNKYMMKINNIEMRQLFTQFRDTEMRNISLVWLCNVGSVGGKILHLAQAYEFILHYIFFIIL